MSALSAARHAATAEIDRLKLFAARQAMRGAYGAGALIFLVAVFCMLHVTGWVALTLAYGPLWASVIVLAIDALLAAVLILLAVKSSPSAAELAAERERALALQNLKLRMAVGIAVPILRHLLRQPAPSVSAAPRARVVGRGP